MTFRKSRTWSLLLAYVFFLAALGIHPVVLPPTADAATQSILPYPRFRAFVTGTGAPLAGGKLYTYLPGTTTPTTTYTTSAGSTANANPVVLDANGEADVWFTGTIKLVLTDSDNVTVWTKDNVGAVGTYGSLTGDNTGNISGFDNGTFTGRVTTADFVTKGPYVDVRAFMDGQSGRPTLATWTSAPTSTVVTTVIQAAVDYAFQNHIGEVRMPDGVFLTDGPIHVGYGHASAPYTSISLIGSGTLMDAATFGYPRTTIKNTNALAPVIAIQGGRSVVIRGLNIVGVDTRYAENTYAGQVSAGNVSYDNVSTATNWVSSAIPANGRTRYAPYAGIAIDPYSGTAPATAYPTVTYPSWTGVGTTQYGKNMSSRTLIEDVTFDGLFVGVVIQPSDYDGNGDFTKIRNCVFQSMAYGVSVGNSQSRSVDVSNCQFSYLHTAFSTNVFGKQVGHFGGPINNCSFSYVYQFADFNNSGYTGPVIINNLEAEVFVRIGNFEGTGAFRYATEINGFGMNYIGWSGRYMTPFASGHSLVLANGVFSNYGLNSIFGSGTNYLDVRNVSFYQSDNTAAWNNPMWSAMAFANCGMLIPANADKYAIDDTIGCSVGSSVSSLPDPYPKDPTRWRKYATGTRTQLAQGARYIRYADYIEPIQSRGIMEPIVAGTFARESAFTGLAFDNSTLTLSGTYDASYQAAVNFHIEPGCILYSDVEKAVFVVDNVAANGPNWDVTATMKNNYWTNAAGTKNVINTIGLTGTAYVFQTFWKTTGYLYRGDTTSGSDNIVNVKNGAGSSSTVTTDFKVGDILAVDTQQFDSPIPKLSKILAVGAGWIRIDKNATDNTTKTYIRLGR